MKIKMIDKGVPLPRCWKSCGASCDDWEELQNGKEIEVKTLDEIATETDVNEDDYDECLSCQ